MRSKMIDFSGVWRSQAADRRSFHGAISRDNLHGRLCHVRRTRFATRTTFPQYGSGRRGWPGLSLSAARNAEERKSVVEGKGGAVRVDRGGGGISKKKKKNKE